MDKKQVIEHTKNYMDSLANGINPITNMPADSDSIAAEPRLRKCFAFVSNLITELLANNGYVSLSGDDSSASQYTLVRKKDPFRLLPEQREQVSIESTAITPTAFVNRINHVIDSQTMEKLSVKSINAWLIENGYVEQAKRSAIVSRTVLLPLPKASNVGINGTETTDPDTGEIRYRLLLTSEAQRFLLNSLDSILPDK